VESLRKGRKKIQKNEPNIKRHKNNGIKIKDQQKFEQTNEQNQQKEKP
jgi:hypothetical protein